MGKSTRHNISDRSWKNARQF